MYYYIQRCTLHKLTTNKKLMTKQQLVLSSLKKNVFFYFWVAFDMTSQHHFNYLMTVLSHKLKINDQIVVHDVTDS